MKKILLLAFFAFYCQARAQAPSNDNCDNAISLTVNADLSCASMTSGTLVGATDSGVTSTRGVADDDVWYSFVATATLHKIKLSNILGTNINLVHEVFEGNCSGQLVSLSISNPTSSLVSGLTVGATYFVRVFTFNATPPDSTTFQLCISVPPPAPANDECAGAIALTINTDANCMETTSGTLVSATNSGVPNTTGTADDDVWYTFIATAATHRIQLSNIRGDATNLVHEVMDGTCGQLLSIASSDPDNSLIRGLTVGSLYYLRIFTSRDFPAESTTFEVCINVPPPPPANDECTGAIVLTVNTDTNPTAATFGTLESASNSQIASPRGTADDDVWYSFVATATSYQISLINRNDQTNLMHEVMSGTCGQLASISISDRNRDSSIITALTVGATYYVRVFSYYSFPVSTTFDISISIGPPPPANDDCTNAIALVPATSYADGAINSTVLGATNSADSATIPDPECADYAGSDVWYTAMIPADGNLILQTGSPIASNDTSFDSGMAVYSGTCNMLELIECNDNGADDYFSIINLAGRTPGETIYVRIWNYDNEDVEQLFSVSAWSPTLGVSTFNEVNFKAYPNPVNDILNLSYDQTISEVSLYNFLGQNVASKSIGNTNGTIDMSGLPSGSYLVKVTAEGQTKTIKVIKQ